MFENVNDISKAFSSNMILHFIHSFYLLFASENNHLIRIKGDNDILFDCNSDNDILFGCISILFCHLILILDFQCGQKEASMEAKSLHLKMDANFTTYENTKILTRMHFFFHCRTSLIHSVYLEKYDIGEFLGTLSNNAKRFDQFRLILFHQIMIRKVQQCKRTQYRIHGLVNYELQ